MAKALIVLAEGFEEIEAVAMIDVLRRGQVDVLVAGLSKLQVKGGHDIVIEADALLADVANKAFDMVILPGGETGVTHFQRSQSLKALVISQAQQGKWIAAICAAPRLLESLGLLKGRKATSHPGTRDKMTTCDYRDDRVVEDGHFMTSRGPGTALEFALTILEKLTSTESATRLSRAMVHDA